MSRKGTAKEIFVQRALDMFLKNGVRTTMDEISRKLKISKRTIYEQFEDKTDLMRACVTRLVETQVEIPDLNTGDVVTTIYHTIKDDVLNLFGQNSIFLLSLRNYYPEIYDELIRPRVDNVLVFVKSGLRKGVEKGLVCREMNEDIFCPYLVGFIFHVTSDSGNMFKRHNHVEVFNSTILPLLRGVLTEEGIRRMDAVIHESEKK